MAGADPKWQKDAADQNFDYMFKLLIIGNSSVGKTSFLFRYADDSFTSAFVSTVGIDFKVKTVFRHDKRVKLQIWVRVALLKFNWWWLIVSFCRIRLDRNGIGPSLPLITGAPWASFLCMILRTRNRLTAFMTGEYL